ncbi:MAG: glycosyltransferase family 2 protein [bacterium]|nr:glycosyltransferase family 2 protein [bacterium]
MLLSVIIPVFNEQGYIVEVIDRIRRQPLQKEIIVVDDGSTDGTGETLRALAGRREIRLLEQPVNRGKGAALRRGLPEANGDIVIFQDADLELDPDDYPSLIEPIVSGHTEVVYGSRFLSRRNRVPLANLLANKALTAVTNLLYRASLTDEATAYKVFRREVIDSIPLYSDGFEICPEITAKLLKAGHRITEVPIAYYPRSREEGKKLSWTDGLVAVATLLRFRFTG